MRSLVYYVATSLDGFIADPDGDTSAFPNDPEVLRDLFARYPETCPAHVRDALGVSGPARRFDTVVMGARTHQPAVDAGLVSAYPHLRQLVVTHRDLATDGTMELVRGDATSRVRDLKSEDGMDIWLCGGADLAAQLVDEIDELQVKVNPVLMGSGVPLTRLAHAPRRMRLAASEQLPGGVLLNTYVRA
ncbi:dihydrofolate reductase family protein [Thalassiella azotivora]